MLAKLLTLLSASKGAAVAAVVVLGAATVTVGSTSPEVQDAVHNVVQAVTGQTTQSSDTAKTFKLDCGGGQPAVVAQRNAATKLIDAAFQKDQKALEDLRGKGVDNKAAGDLIKTADGQLKDLRTKALNDVAALTLGRDGQNKPSGSPTAKPSGSPAPSASPCPSESPEASESAKPSESPKPSGSPKAEGSAKPSEQGRVAVADRTTLDANIKAIVDKAIADMDQVVTDATAKVGALPSPDHGKPSGQPGAGDHGKPSEVPGLNPSDQPGGKPSASPKP
ncbi:MAG TPA: hypothetical protein VIN69_01975 [Candidatus Limnocylindria bacterium]|jgi:hypothetical protein